MPAAPLARLRPMHPAHGVLIGLLVAGLALRIFAEVAWWPTTTHLADSLPYSLYAAGAPLENPQHPAGYPWLLQGLGLFSREIAFTIIVQHLLGIASALLLYAAAARVCGSPWPGLLPAAVILLNPDQVLLEHALMSEGPFVFLVAAALYAAARALDAPDPWWRWPVACGALIVAATTLRSSAAVLAPVVLLALLFGASRPWRVRWHAPAALAGAVLVLLSAYALASEATTGRLQIGPAQGWRLYARVAPIADCTRFTPPEGTAQLCEERPFVKRPGGNFYLFDPASPAVRAYGGLGEEDGKVGAFAREAILHQPRDYLSVVWTDVKAYFVPSSRIIAPAASGDLDPELSWSVILPPNPPDELGNSVAVIQRDVEMMMERFYDDFSVDVEAGSLQALRDYQDLFRFGATPLTVAAILSLIGLLVGSRRARVGVFVFGIGGLAMLLLPLFGQFYAGRFSVPSAGPVAAGAAIALLSAWRLAAGLRAARRGESTGRTSAT